MKFVNSVHDVIATNAVNTKNSFFFATHSVFKNLEFSVSGNDNASMVRVDELLLYDEKFKKTLDRDSFIPILGDNGSGKSHFIKWLYHKIDVDPELSNREFEVIFVGRQNATLQNAIRQLVNNSFFESNNDLKKKFNSLLNASNTENVEHIMSRFIFELSQLILDGNDEHFNSSYREAIRDFLLDRYVQENLLKKKGGFIERIQEKIVGDQNVRNMKDPTMKREDIQFNQDFRTKLKLENVSKRVIKIADKLYEDDDNFCMRLANYINTLMNDAIQKSVELSSSDFSHIFRTMRRELYKANKTLVLLIEDITSLTGLDLTLINLLVDENDPNNKQMCNLISVIGITTQYYQNLPGHIKDRITFKVNLTANAIFEDDQSILEFTHKYINALYVEESRLLKWIEEGHLGDDIPTFVPEEFGKWSYIDEKKSIFPFNSTAIFNLVNQIPRSELTPRKMLNGVLRDYLLAFDGSLTNFPPSNNEFYKSGVLYRKFTDDNQKKSIANYLINKGQLDRYLYFMMLYSNHDFSKVDGIFAGINDEVYKMFDFEIDFKAIGGTISKKPLPSNSSENVNKLTHISDKLLIEKQSTAYENELNNIDGWRRKNTEQVFKAERQRLWAIIGEVLEGYSEFEDYNINFHFNKQRADLSWFTIDDKKQTNDKLLIQNSELGEQLLKASIRYKYLGDSSFNYEFGLSDLLCIDKFIRQNISIIRVYLESKKNSDFVEMIESLIYLSELEGEKVRNLNVIDHMTLILSKDFITGIPNKVENLLEILSDFKDAGVVRNFYSRFNEGMILSNLSEYCLTIGDTRIETSKDAQLEAYKIIGVIKNVKSQNGKWINNLLTSIEDYINYKHNKYYKKIEIIRNDLDGVDFISALYNFLQVAQNKKVPMDNDISSRIVYHFDKNTFSKIDLILSSSSAFKAFELIEFNKSRGHEYIKLYDDFIIVLGKIEMSCEAVIKSSPSNALELNRKIYDGFDKLYNLIGGDSY